MGEIRVLWVLGLLGNVDGENVRGGFESGVLLVCLFLVLIGVESIDMRYLGGGDSFGITRGKKRLFWLNLCVLVRSVGREGYIFHVMSANIHSGILAKSRTATAMGIVSCGNGVVVSFVLTARNRTSKVNL